MNLSFAFVDCDRIIVGTSSYHKRDIRKTSI